MIQGNVDTYVTEGWIDDNTFQVRSLGAPNQKATGFVRRRTQSKEAALLASQKRVIELLIGKKVEGASGSDSGESTGVAISSEFEGVVKGGSVVKESYNENDDCEMTYRIHADGLKKRAETEAQKQDFRK